MEGPRGVDDERRPGAVAQGRGQRHGADRFPFPIPPQPARRLISRAAGLATKNTAEVMAAAVGEERCRQAKRRGMPQPGPNQWSRYWFFRKCHGLPQTTPPVTALRLDL